MRPDVQTTLIRATEWISGSCLDNHSQTEIRFCPAEENSGIVFVRTDLPGKPEIRCEPENLQSMPRWTALARDDIWVHHTEHVLAAVAIVGIDNVRVEMKTDRLPMTRGGTCVDFVIAMKKSGLREQTAARRFYNLTAPGFILDGQNTQGESLGEPTLQNGRYIAGLPADGYYVTTVFHWPHLPGLPLGVAEYEISDTSVDTALLEARSYLVETERDQVKDLLGPVRDEVMQLYRGCPPELAGEAARHKIVDFIGDLMVLGYPLRGRFIAVRAGHRIHHDFLRHLLANGLLKLEEV